MFVPHVDVGWPTGRWFDSLRKNMVVEYDGIFAHCVIERHYRGQYFVLYLDCRKRLIGNYRGGCGNCGNCMSVVEDFFMCKIIPDKIPHPTGLQKGEITRDYC